MTGCPITRPTTRRGFLRTLAVGAAGLAFAADVRATAAAATFQPDLMLALDAAGRVRLTVRKVEMGQGAHAGLRAILAEELDLEPGRIELAQATSDPKFGQILTGGSFTAAGGWATLRLVGATARLMLVRAAAARWNEAPGRLATDGGAVLHPDGRRLPYGDLVADAARQPRPAPDAVRPKERGRHRIVGTGAGGVSPYHTEIVRGAARYGIDARLPGMLYASIERSPVIGGRAGGVDDAAARRVPGVVDVIALPGTAWPSQDHVRAGVAVLAENSWAAQRGRAALEVRWEDGPHQAFDSAAEMAEMVALCGTPGLPCRLEGSARDAAAAPPGARTAAAIYTFPYLAHAPMEPPNALAWVRDGFAEVWTGTQRQRRLHDALVRELGLPADGVLVHAPLLGGGFGRRLEVDYGLEAALLSRAAGRPVQVLWTREDDLTRGLYRPASAHRLTGWLDGAGMIGGHVHRTAAQSVFAQQEPGMMRPDGGDWTVGIPMATYGYAAANLAFEHHPMPARVPVAWWRGTASTTVQVAQECFMDELAALAGADPLEFRLRHLPPGRVSRAGYTEGEVVTFEADLMRRVLAAAAQAGGWGAPAPDGALGIACGLYDCPATYTACVAEVALRDGRPRVTRLVVATDCGLAVTPDVVRAQLVGGAVFALGSVFGQSIDFAGGRVRQRSFGDFPLPALADMPEIVPLVLESDRPPSGIGEPCIPVVTAAVMNAVSSATGRRVRSLPLGA
ncbi:MAG TPA: molybdopterin cofactor-binding domain-containing protein [Azospirillaceae bacterium]|nr:molybdopterin cofactor-binding domain-containing protein [Azospirillaceae bacterium]